MDDIMEEFETREEKFDPVLRKSASRKIAKIIEAEGVPKYQDSINIAPRYLGIRDYTQGDSLSMAFAKKKLVSEVHDKLASRSMDFLFYEKALLDSKYAEAQERFVRALTSGKTDAITENMETGVRPARFETAVAADIICSEIVFKDSLLETKNKYDLESLLFASACYGMLTEGGKKKTIINDGKSPKEVFQSVLSEFREERDQYYQGIERLVYEYNEITKNPSLFTDHELSQLLGNVRYSATEVKETIQRIDSAKEGYNIFRDAMINSCRDKEITLPQKDASFYEYLGNGLIDKELVIEGSVGNYAGTGNKNGKITIKGNAGEKTGYGMKGGTLIIDGEAATIEGLEGGEIYVHGEAKIYNDTMKGGKVFIKDKQVYPGLLGRFWGKLSGK